MTKIKHRLINHKINSQTEIVIIGTFNPDTKENVADFFYGRQKNFLWTLLPIAFGETSLKGKSKEEKIKFITKFKIDFIDLISEVDVTETSNYKDDCIDNKVTEWKNVIAELDKVPNIKKVCLTRKSFSGIPNMKKKIDKIKMYCEQRKIPFQFLITPARIYTETKQMEWTNFLTTS